VAVDQAQGAVFDRRWNDTHWIFVVYFTANLVRASKPKASLVNDGLIF
jgi:hypothetical protein